MIAGGITAGTAATAATGGTGFAPAAIVAGKLTITGFTIFGLGMGEIANGLAGNDSLTVSAIKALYNTPPEATAVNIF